MPTGKVWGGKDTSRWPSAINARPCTMYDGKSWFEEALRTVGESLLKPRRNSRRKHVVET